MNEIEQRAVTAEFLHHRPDGENAEGTGGFVSIGLNHLAQDSNAPPRGSNGCASGVRGRLHLWKGGVACILTRRLANNAGANTELTD